MSELDPTTPGRSLEDRLAAIPRVDALAAETGFVERFTARFREQFRAHVNGWSPRHTRVALLAAPAFYLAYGNSVGSYLPGNQLVLVSLALASVLGGLFVATYTPEPGSRPTAPLSCVGSALFPVLLALFLFQDALATPAVAAIAATLVAVGLAQRIYGAEACAAQG